MRIQMRPKGRPAGIRGSITIYNPVSGNFTVSFDVILSGLLAGHPSIVSTKVLNFEAGTDGSITDTTFNLKWEIMNQ